jgi:tetratricopeptide (TPR) repeat protein
MHPHRWALLLLVLLLLPNPARSEESPPRDPDVLRANGMLGEKSQWPSAIELYREALSSDPENTEARLWLARVLSWNLEYDSALAEYDRLLASEDPIPPARIERAEVLSWAGRYDEAEDGFVAMLDENPEDARAARGLARVYNWSGRTIEADRAYARALDLEEDAEARAEWSALWADHPQTAALRAEHFADDEDFSRNALRVEGAFFASLSTRVVARAALIRVEHELAEALGFDGEDSAGELTLGLERQLDERWRAAIDLGARSWQNAGTAPMARGSLQYRAPWDGVASFEIDHRDGLETTQSLAAVEDDVRVTRVGLSLWKGFSPKLESFVELRTGHLSDSNTSVRAAGTLSYRPWPTHEFRVHVGLDYLQYSDDSPLYYAPESDVSTMLRLSHYTSLPLGVVFDGTLAGGWGQADEGGITGSGLAFDAGLALSREFGRWRLSLEGSIAQSWRAEVYRAQRVVALFGRDF